MAALYTDLKVQNVKMTIDTPTPSRSPAPPAPLNEKRGEGEVGAGRREKSVILRQVVTGLARG
ncbi:hypothetical protein JR316_0011782 [Psilocybe cubensis]|nr:hypothetical protein JR316_0011782 [Psilocybe cubensis]KAH9476211.1 hypothetical protein JR316_0011782 [Psilocybe cubensis]